MPDDLDGSVSRTDLETLVGIAEIQVILSRGRPRLMFRSQAQETVARPDFPKPLIVYPKTGRTHVRLWLLVDVEGFARQFVPGWDELPAAPES